jgi:hypothetical protein
MEETNAADDLTGRLFNHGKLAVTAVVPMAEHPPHVSQADLNPAGRSGEGNLLLLQHLGILMNDQERFGVKFFR